MDGTHGASTKKMKQVLKSYHSRLTYNELPLRIVMYSCNHMYEYNPYDNEIRPFNSLVWYNLESYYDMYNFTLFIKQEYDKIVQDESQVSNIGTISEGVLFIDLDNLGNIILPEIDSIDSKTRLVLISSYNIFMAHVSLLYKNWKTIIEQIESF